MKNFTKLFLLQTLIALTFSIPVSAASIETTNIQLEEATTEEDNGNAIPYASDNEYQKLKKEAEEKYQSNKENPMWWETGNVPEEIKDCVSFVGKDYVLTEEQVNEGYILNSGYLISPEAYDMGEESRVISGGVQADSTTGYVTFTASVPTGIHTQAYANFIRYGSFEEYDVTIEEVNGYTSTLCLPEGTYSVSAGGLSIDNTGRFFVAPFIFTVSPGESTIVELEVNDMEAEYTTNQLKDMKQKEFEESQKNNTEITEPTESSTENTMEIEEIEEEKGSIVMTIIGLVIFLGIPLGYVIYKMKNKNK